MNKLIIGLSFAIVIMLVAIIAGLIQLNSQGKLTDLTGGTSDFERTYLAYSDKGTINPWPHADPETDDVVSLPDQNTLLNIYLEIRKAYAARDYELYKKYASSERIWHMEHDKVMAEGMFDDLPVFAVTEIDGQENFTDHGLLLCVIDAPEIANLEVSGVVWESEEKSPGKFIMVDSISKERYLVEGQNWKYRANLQFNIKDNSYQTGTGTVFFVYDEGVWKYHFEDWENTFVKDKTLGDQVFEQDSLFAITYENNAYSPEVLNVSPNSVVVWPKMSGFIFTAGESIEHFSSPLLDDAVFQKRFTVPGKYEYVIYGIDYSLLFTGTINVSE